MQLLLLLLLMTTCRSHKVVESTEDLSPEHFISGNSTTLLQPVNRTHDRTSSASTWKIATSLTDSQENVTTAKEHLDAEPTTEKPENASAKFKPSPQLSTSLGTLGTLGAIEDNFVVPTSESYGPFSPVLRRPPAFFSSYKEERLYPFNKIPPETFKHYPYKLERPLTKTKEDWQPYKPLVEAPKIPAEVYLPETVRDKPEFGVDFHGDLREVAFKKRPPPMHGLVRLLAALIPVGVIVSALTPGVLTLETSANTNINHNTNSINNNIFRRTDTAAGLPPISERCRRRLLCELQQDHHYQRSVGGGGCHRMRCEDPAALRTALGLLLRGPGSASAGNH